MELNLNDIIEVRFVCYTGDQIAVNRRHYKVTAKTGAGRTTQQVAAAFDTAVHAAYKPLMSDEARYRGVSVQRVFPGPRTAVAAVVANDGAGTSAGTLLPKQVCGLITFRTVFAGRQFRGRMYVPFPSEVVNDDDGRPIGGYMIFMDTLADAIIAVRNIDDNGDAVTVAPVLWRPGQADGTPITTYVSRTEWATQRRRGDFGRLNNVPF